MNDVTPTIDLAALADALVARIPRVPLEHALWDTDDVARYLKISPRTMEDLKRKAGFPAACRPTESDRWIAAEVIEWAKLQRAKVPKGRKAA